MPYCWDYSVGSFEIRKCKLSSFVLFQDHFGCLGPLQFHIRFRMFFLQTSHGDSERDGMESVDGIGWPWSRQCVKPPSPLTREVLPCVNDFRLSPWWSVVFMGESFVSLVKVSA